MWLPGSVRDSVVVLRWDLQRDDVVCEAMLEACLGLVGVDFSSREDPNPLRWKPPTPGS